jgi:hypothetical protein
MSSSTPDMVEMRVEHSPFDEDILMSHDGIAYTISLIFHTSQRENKISGYDGTFEFKGHFGACHETLGVEERITACRK